MPASNSLTERLLHYAETASTRDALVTSELTYSYSQLLSLVRAQAKKYIELGISSNSIVGIRCADDTQHLILCLAASYVGATSCTIPSYETKEIQNRFAEHYDINIQIIVDAETTINPAAIVDNSSLCNTVAPAAEGRLLFSTSGTTGKPKFVIHHDGDLVAQAHRHIGSSEERFACLASMEHNFAKRHRLYCVATGATNVFLDTFKEKLLAAQCLALRTNVLHVSAFQAQELLAAPDINKLSDIRLKLGGSHAPILLRQQLRSNITENLQAGYGTTETGAIAFTDPDDSEAGESVGRPLPGIEVRTVSPERAPLAKGECGELAIRCDGMFRGYFGRPDLTEGKLEHDWFYTGDIGYLDAQQRIHLCGRSDDMFVFNSMNIYPQDIESQICQHPDVIDAAVLPKESSVHENIPVALVVFTENSKPNISALSKFVKNRVGLRSPRQFSIVDEIPRNSSGKILRFKATTLSLKSDQVRKYIIQALDNDITDRLKPSLITDFENGKQDIVLHEIGMDSLARMELLISLEMEYGSVITPQAFGGFRTLGEIASFVLSSEEENASAQAVCEDDREANANTATAQSDDLPHVVRFFQRVFRLCNTTAQLSKALTSLEHRLTPAEFFCLQDWHHKRQLIPISTVSKFRTTLHSWLADMEQMIGFSGKQDPELYTMHKVAPTVTHYVGPGQRANKTLLVCFSTRGSRRIMIPNPVLMQHTDSSSYDMLIVSEPLAESYFRGVPFLGKSVIKAIEQLEKLDLIKDYSNIRTLGCSAGAYPAVIAGYILNAEMAVAIGGRFHHPNRHPVNTVVIRVLNRIFTTWRATFKGHCSRVLMSYAKSKRRDRRYARTIAQITGGSRIAVEFDDDKIGHRVFAYLLDRGELAPYLARTIFAKCNDEIFGPENTNIIMSFPGAKIQHRKSSRTDYATT